MSRECLLLADSSRLAPLSQNDSSPPQTVTREYADLNRKNVEIAIAVTVIPATFAAISYSYFKSRDISEQLEIQFEEAAESVSRECEPSTENQECRARGPILSAPYFINGVIQGYRVYPSEDAELFESTGLEFGDLVVAVEGQPLTEVELVNQLLESLANGQPVRVSVERNGTIDVIDLLSDQHSSE